jgi:ketosteroid isomerase-like protein
MKIWREVLSGDLAYTYGVYEFHSKDKEGRPTLENGKYTTIWKKPSGGQWKVVLDMRNVSPKLAVIAEALSI